MPEEESPFGWTARRQPGRWADEARFGRVQFWNTRQGDTRRERPAL